MKPMSPTVPPPPAGPSEQRPIYIPRQKRRGYDAAAAADADAPPNPAGGASASSFASERAAATMAGPSSSIYASSSAGGIARKRPRIAQQQKIERFHGAFTGGFSAGYYNTVGSREGWQPAEYGASTASRKELPGQSVPQQSIHSFMDEQDHNEWGGPQGIRNEFVSADHSVGAASTAAAGANKKERLTDPFTVQFRSGVGEQLLRVLGWRGSSASSAAYVLDDAAHTATKEAGKDDPSYLQILSTKRLRRIEMSQVQVKVPDPKLDFCGLGYEPFRDAPEFARHFQERRKRAELRAGGNQRSNASGAYRTSDIYEEEGDDDDGSGRMRRRARSPNAGSRTYVSKDDDDGHDFVGTRSFGGFALLDDEDDAYDDIGSRGASNLEAFDTELDLDEEADHDVRSRLDSALPQSLSRGEPRQAPSNETSVQGIFSSWAASSLTPVGAAGGETAVTSDGRPILPGFVLSATVTSGTKRHRGPDVPLNYEASNHVFGPREHPLVYQVLLHAERLQSTEDAYQMSVREALRVNSVARSSQPSAGNAGPIRAMSHKMASFAGVSKAMERRFTKAATAEETPSEGSTGEARGAVATPRSSEKATRTFATFVPSAMLCKRLGVPAPKTFELTSSTGRTKEESFFQNEVLSRLPASRDKVESSAKREQESTSIGARAPPSDQEALLAALNSQVPPQSPGDDRPPVALYKSIFEPSTNELEEAQSDDGNRDARRLLRDEKTTRRSPTSASYSSSYTETAELGDSAPPSDGSKSLRAKDMTFTTGYTLEGAVDSTRKYRERENQQKESSEKMKSQAMSSDKEDASESTGSMGYSPNDRKSRKARKRKRKKRKEKKRKRAH
jgi:G patch domain-containing protein 1